MAPWKRGDRRLAGFVSRFFLLFIASVSMFLVCHPAAVMAADGSGTDVVAPTAVIASSTGNTLNFTFTAGEAMNSGGFTITVPSGWSVPTSTVGVPGYTLATSGAGIIANVLDNADSSSGWSAGTACANGLSASTTVKEEGTASIACVNGAQSTGNRFYKNITAQNWSGYTTVGLWVRTSIAVTANRLQFTYSSTSNLGTPVTFNLPAISANTWTYFTVTLTGTRSSVASFGFTLNHNTNFDNMKIYVDDLLIGPGVPTFPGGGVIRTNLLSLASGQTVVVSYGSGGGASGAVAPPTGRSSTFVTQSRTTDGGTLTTIASSPIVTVNNPIPTLASISPTTKNVGDGTFTLTLNGTNYNASSTAYFGATALGTTYVSSTQVTASVPGSLLTVATSVNIIVANPAPGGGTSTAQTLMVNNPVPTLTSISPTSTNVGSPDTTLTVTGANFVSNSVVKFNGASLTTTFNSSTQLTATVVSSSLLVAGTYNIAVFNPTPGGGTSTNQVFTVNNVVPELDSISPVSVEAGSADFVLTLNDGSSTNNYEYATNAVANIDGHPLVTTFVNPRHLTAVVPASYVAVSGTHQITVFNPSPGGGTSTAAVLSVVDTTPPAITITAPTKISQTTITDTTIHVTNTAILAANVVVATSTTAGTSNFSCVQTSSTIVDCTIHIISSGFLVIQATDNDGNVQTATELGYRVDATPPVVTITAPVTVSSSTITNTTIHVTDNDAITASHVVIDPSTTAGTSSYSCSQTNGTTVDCTVSITSSGSLTIKATDDAGNVATSTQSGYIVDATPPVITITAPTKIFNDVITNTTIYVTDNNAITAANVILDPSTTDSPTGFNCTQTDSKTVDCTINILSSGNLVIKATDNAGNVATQSETGYVIETTPPTVDMTAPTKTSSSTIMDTTIHVADDVAIAASSVIIDPSTTAGSSHFSCSQTNGTTVDCTVWVTSSGNLVIRATDAATNFSQQAVNNYVIETAPPVVAITAPTTVSSSTIVNTTIHVTDNNAITASNVVVDPSTTAGTSAFSCSQTGPAIVDCTVSITSSGSLVIKATDAAGNIGTDSRSGYVIETTPPVVSITAPTKASSVDITDTTIHVTDNNAITASNVIIDPSTTAATHNFNCLQTDSKTVDCTVEIDASGDLVIKATDGAGNVATGSSTGYVIDTSLPAITITTPTLIASSTITNTTIHVTDGAAITAASVVIDPSTTAGTSAFSCSQTSSTAVDCTIHITSSGNLTIKATDIASNVSVRTASGYVIDTSLPVITITAPTTSSTHDIGDTTIHVTDNDAIFAGNVVVDPSTTAGTHNFVCTQTNSTTTDCTIEIDASGNLVIKATDRAGNSSTQLQSGYVVNHLGPTILITAPTKTSNATITDTTIHVTGGSTAVSSTSVLVSGTSTAGTSAFSCSQTSSTAVDCTIHITSSGSLTITATNVAAQTTTDTEDGYVIDPVAPVIIFTAPTKTSSSTISDTTIHVTDNHAITATNVTVSTSTTVTTNSFFCTQTNGTTVDCTVNITSSGDFGITAMDDAGNVTSNTSTGYAVDLTRPTILITAPTKTSSSTISDTTIHVTDDTAVASSSVVVDPSTTAGTGSFNCIQTDSKTVDCTIGITASGNLVIRATDAAANVRTDFETGYVIETTPPVVTITAPTKTSNATITDTTVHVTDNDAILAANVVVDGSSSADVSDLICTQTNTTTVDCTLHVNSSGDLAMNATDVAGNSTLQPETGYTVGSTAPIISAVSASPANTSAVITWTTNSLSSSRVTYSTDFSFALVTAETDTSPRVTSHTVSLSGLTSCTTYHYKVVSTDLSANSTTSSGSVFTTTGCAVPSPTTGGGGSSMSASGYLPPAGPFSVSLLGGGTVAPAPTVTLVLSAGSDVNRMAISRFPDFHDAGIVPFATTASWSLCGAVDCAPGSYDVYVTFYQSYGLASPVQHLALTYVAGAAPHVGTINEDKDIPISALTNVRCRAGSLIKGSLSSVYYCGNDGQRYVFPNEKIYFTWYSDFSGVQRISNAALAAIPLGGNVTYRPGIRLIKIKTDPKVYAVDHGGVLRWVASEAVAKALFGSNWNKLVDDLSDAFFVDYTVGTPLTAP